jgi:hypothetical protein
MAIVAPKSVGFYRLYLNLWIMRKVTQAELQALVPTFLTQEECDMILATPQIPE